MLLGVIRGKTAEGIDFKDDNARAVLIVGIPFPPIYDDRIRLKKSFLDQRIKANTGSLSGDTWYTLREVLQKKNDKTWEFFPY